MDAKVLTNIDAYAFGQLCSLMGELDELRDFLKPIKHEDGRVARNGPIVLGANGYPVVSPVFRAISQKTEQVRRMMIEFGMTPSSRARVGTTGESSGGEFDF